MNVAYDIFGTLLLTESRLIKDVEKARVNKTTLDSLFNHLKRGDKVTIISARPSTCLEQARVVLRNAGVPDSIEIIMPDEWRGVKNAINFKKQMMKKYGIELYYGDSERIDAIACKELDIKFVKVSILNP